MSEPINSKTVVTLEEIFGEQTSRAVEVLDAMEVACLKATSNGEIQRLQRLGRAKLKMLRNIAFQRDNA
tara:strand:+ start:232 stop:438 length:207 start_codon:yes stop_codon:yes gene_type:complete